MDVKTISNIVTCISLTIVLLCFFSLIIMVIMNEIGMTLPDVGKMIRKIFVKKSHRKHGRRRGKWI